MRLLGCVRLCIALLFCGLPLWAQDRSAFELQVSGGARNAIIEGTCSTGGGQAFLAAAFRYHIRPRTSVGPEVSFIRPCDRQTFTFYHPRVSGMLQIAQDLTSGERIRPYLIGGAGLVRHKSQFAPAQTKFEAAGGGGVKVFLGKSTFVAPEVQVGGGVASIRYSLGVGVVLR